MISPKTMSNPQIGLQNEAIDLKTKGNQLFLKKEYESAICTYQKAITRLGNEESDCKLKSTILSNIGVCLYKLEKYKSALESFSKAIDCQPDWEKPFLKRKDVFDKMKERMKLGEQTDMEKEEVRK